MRTESIIINKDRDVVLTAYLQSVKGEFDNIVKRPAILILPGGGYYMCSDREADPVAFHYLKAGYQVFILRYSVGENAAWPNPLKDYEAAMGLIRSNQEIWNLYSDKVAVIGFSAGGHLAACAATMSEDRPNAAILGYPVIDEDTVSAYLPSAPDAAAAVDENTCSCFLFASRNDTTVPVRNSLKMMTALAEYDISYESHIYAYAPHGFSSCDSSLITGETKICNRAQHWINDSIEWLKDIFGDFADREMSAPKCGVKINGNYAPCYNMDCTMGYLLQNAEVVTLLEPFYKPMLGDAGVEKLLKAFSGLLLKEFMQFLKISTETLKEIDMALGKIRKQDM